MWHRETPLGNFFLGVKLGTVEVGKLLGICWILAGLIMPSIPFLVTGVIYLWASYSLKESLEQEEIARRKARFCESEQE